jgi:hypothetical protein
VPDDYFRDGGRYRFDMHIMLGGPISDWYDRPSERWVVRQRYGGRTWEGVGESRGAAVLDLIAQRMDAFPPHRPHRGSDVEAWLKAKRDEHRTGGRYEQDPFDTIDALLDDYRLHADTGVLLDGDEPMGPTTAGVTDDA